MKHAWWQRVTAHIALGVFVGIAIWAIVFAIWQSGGLSDWEQRLLDVRFHARHRLGSVAPSVTPTPNGDDPGVTVVAVDERALAAFGKWPWPLHLQGHVLDEMSRFRPAVIGLDVLYSETDPRDAPDFAAYFPEDIPVVLAAAENGDQWQYPRFDLLAPNVTVAHVHLPADSDGVVRRWPVSINSPYGDLHAFAAALVAHAPGDEGAGGSGRYDTNEPPLINFMPATDPSWMRTISVVDLFDDTSDNVRDALEGRIVIFGVTAASAGGGSRHVTPIRSLGVVPGVYVHASVVATMLGGDATRVNVHQLSVVWLLLTAVAVGIFAFAVRPAVGALVGLAGVGLTAGIGFWAFAYKQVAVPMTPFMLAIAVVAVGGSMFRYGLMSLEARQTLVTFERYVSKDVAQELLSTPGTAGMAGARRHVTVLFADIRGFTAYVEGEIPERVVGVLNKYFELMGEAIHGYGGMIDKYLGDGMMAVFGAPMPAADHAPKATAAALAMIEAVDEMVAADVLPLQIGVGLHTGEVLVGSVGPWERQEYTAVGDVVNVAARLEQHAAPGCLYITKQTYDQLPGSLAQKFVPVPSLPIRGRNEKVHVYVSRPGVASAQRNTAGPSRNGYVADEDAAVPPPLKARS